MPASNATFFGTVTLDGGEHRLRLQAGRRRAAAVGLPRRHARAAGRWRRTSCPRRSAGTSYPRPCCAATRPAGLGMVQAWREPDEGQDPVDLVPDGRDRRRATCTSSTPTTATTGRSRWCTRTPTRCAGWRSSTSWSTTPTARAGTCWRCPTGTASASTTGSSFHVDDKLADRAVGLGPPSRWTPRTRRRSARCVERLAHRDQRAGHRARRPARPATRWLPTLRALRGACCAATSCRCRRAAGPRIPWPAF